MFKKPTLLAMAALVVFALPAAAWAEPIVTNGLGEDTTDLTAVSSNMTMTTGLGTSEACGTVDLKLTGSTGTMEVPAPAWVRAKKATADRVNHPMASQCTLTPSSPQSNSTAVEPEQSTSHTPTGLQLFRVL